MFSKSRNTAIVVLESWALIESRAQVYYRPGQCAPGIVHTEISKSGDPIIRTADSTSMGLCLELPGRRVDGSQPFGAQREARSFARRRRRRLVRWENSSRAARRRGRV